MELLRERDELLKERAGLEDLLDSGDLQWARDRATSCTRCASSSAPRPNGGARRTMFEEAVEVAEVPFEAMIEREPITVICSKMGWIRAMKGHQPLDIEVKFKDGDEGQYMFHAETTDRLVLFGSNGRFYTISAANLPGGRGMGEPVRLMVDLPNEAAIVALFPYRSGRRLLVASSEGDGFIVSEDEVLAQTRAGKQVLNVGQGRGPGLPARSRAITSPASARTARCWCSRWPSCPRWSAARACGCRSSRTAACRTRRPLRWPTG